MALMSTANARSLPVMISTLTLMAATSALGENKAFSLAQQNALVHKYCAVCHTDASRNGGLSLEHYDAGTPDPALAAMLLSKLRNGAMGAAGLGIPDKATSDAWIAATTTQAEGAKLWSVIRGDEAESKILIASVIREVAPRIPGTDSPVYRLTLMCDASKRQGEMQLTWSPQPQTERTFWVAVDGKPEIAHRLEGTEKMGNGTAGTSGRAGTILNAPLSQKTLTVKDLFPSEAVAFPVGELDQQVRRQLATCFASDSQANR
jgi:mono/diheme cytochrome c family protein